MVTVSSPAAPVTATVLVALPVANVKVLVNAPRTITSAPLPPLIVAAAAAVKVKLSAPVPPVMDSMVAMLARVLAPFASTRVSLPMPPMTVPAVTAADSVKVSLPSKPVATSTPVIVTLLVPAARFKLSAPAPRSMVMPEAVAASVMVWLAPSPVMEVIPELPNPIMLPFAPDRASISQRATLTISTAILAVTDTVSVPAPPSKLSSEVNWPAPSMTRVSAPVLPVTVSLPALGVMMVAVFAVIVSFPASPVTLSTLVTVTLLVKLPRVKVSATPPPRSTDKPVTAAPIVMVCAVVPAAISVIEVILVEEIVIVSLLAPLNSSTSTPLTDEATV